MPFFGKKQQERIIQAQQGQAEAQDYWSIVRRQFKRNRLAVWSLRLFYLILFMAVFADFIANEKPLYCKIAGQTHFPVFKEYFVDMGLSQWEPEFISKAWHEHEYESVIFPPISYSPGTMDKKNTRYTSPLDAQELEPNLRHHVLGTDKLGRDVAAGMVHGTRVAMLVGIVSMSIATLIGILLGSLAGYFGDERFRVSRIRVGLNILALLIAFFFAFIVRSYSLGDGIGEGYFFTEMGYTALIFLGCFAAANLLCIPLKKVPILGKRMVLAMDILVMRLIEIISSIPVLILILAVLAVIKTPSIIYVMIIIGLVSWPGIAKFIRAELLRVRSLEYIEAAQALGYSELRIIIRHAIPNALAPVLITIAFGIASAILTESFLSFLSVGVPADQVTWGSLLNASRGNPSAWWLAIFPGFAIFSTVTLLNLIGEGLTDALDPRLKE